MNGIIKKYLEDKGFGFIKTDKEDIFFHVSNVAEESDIAEGVKVSFEIGKNDRGSFAKDVCVISE